MTYVVELYWRRKRK